MTLRVPVLLLTAILLGGVVESRADCVNYLEFPSPFTHNTTWVAYGTCIQDPARYDAGGRLRWGDNNNGQLQLFDTDDHGQLIWCAHDDSDHDTCVTNGLNSLGAQWDGNLVIYDSYGKALWASNTVGSNEEGEVLTVCELYCPSPHTISDHAIIFADAFNPPGDSMDGVWIEPQAP
jgi:hypothetical protein